MKNLTLKNLLQVCGGEYIGSGEDLGKEVIFVTTDSRAAAPGCLFAAIAGEHADGHDYIAQAQSKGALCALAERIPENCAGNVIKAESTLKALQSAAEFYRSQFDIPVLGVTGSVGKTTAKEMVSCVLGRRFRTHKTAGNFNNDLGVPLTVFGLGESHEAAVVELGVSHFGDMARIAAIARPTMALFTNIGSAHLEYLGSRRGILKEKTVMEDFLPQDGLVFYNGDDDELSGRAWSHAAVSFGLGAENDVRAENVAAPGDGCTECLIISGTRRIPVRIPAFGEHMVYAALSGAAVGMALGLTDREISEGIASYVPVGRRGRFVNTGFVTLLDDCYNANPDSVAAALRSLSQMRGLKIAILGDMLELGENSAELHRKMGSLAYERGIDLLITCGEMAREMAAAHPQALHFDSREELIRRLPELIPGGANVLVKASHSMGFENISAAVEKLK